MAITFAKLFESVSCLLLVCTYEYPSDPTGGGAQSKFESIQLSGRSARILPDFQENSIYGYDFSRGSSNPIVSTNIGRLEGYLMKSIKGRSIFAFDGIPYGETTGGANRFKPPIPKTPWRGVRSAKKPGEHCLQRNPLRLGRYLGDEDCLFLNIYVPAVKTHYERIRKVTSDFQYPWRVMDLWCGSDYGPAYLLEHDVILVTINYRLGIFGFFSTGDEHLPGNMGQKDQREAMIWVHENIENFGGDPKRVTIAGQSGGAASVFFHVVSNSSHPYFSGAISMSGTGFSSWAIQNRRTIKVRNKQLAAATKCPLSSTRKFVECLRKIDGRTLVRKTRSLGRSYDNYLLDSAVTLGVVIEEDRPGAFLTEHPDDIYDRGGAAKVPYMITSTSDEMPLSFDGVERIQGMFNRISRGSGQTLFSIFRNVMPGVLDYKNIEQNPDIFTEKIIDFYMRSSNGKPRLANLTAIGQVISDRLMGYGVHKTLQRHSEVAPTYSYFYGYHGRATVLSFYLGIDPQKMGVGHADDINMLFNTSAYIPGQKTTDREYSVVRLFTSTFYNFAAKGEPLYTDDDGNVHRIWTPITDPRDMQVLEISNEGVKMIPEPNKKRLKFWDTVGLPDIRPFIPFD